LAARVGVQFSDDNDVSEAASVEWVRSLAALSRGATSKTIGWLQKAHASSPAALDAAVQALDADGRFTVDYMSRRSGAPPTPSGVARLAR